MRYLTFALGKGRLANETLAILESRNLESSILTMLTNYFFDMQKVLKKIKKTLACGGSLKVYKKGYLLEFQGEHLEILKKLLKKEFFCFNK